MIKHKFAFLVFLFVFPCVLFAQEKMNILSYNVLKGFQSDSVLQHTYVNWVAELAPDIIAYQEMNDFTQATLEKFAKRYNHNYAVLSKTDGFPVALSSKYPIVNVQKVVDNMWHAYLYANINNVHVFVVHFSPFSYVKRQSEMQEILARVSLIPKNEPIVIMGDFNSLSVDDSVRYDAKFLEREINTEKKRSIVRNLNNGQIDYSVTNMIRNAGFIDALYIKDRTFRHTIPTKKYAGGKEKRIDYVWVNKALAKKVMKTEVLYDAVTDHLSDHYPIYIEIKTKH